MIDFDDGEDAKANRHWHCWKRKGIETQFGTAAQVSSAWQESLVWQKRTAILKGQDSFFRVGFVCVVRAVCLAAPKLP